MGRRSLTIEQSNERRFPSHALSSVFGKVVVTKASCEVSRVGINMPDKAVFLWTKRKPGLLFLVG